MKKTGFGHFVFMFCAIALALAAGTYFFGRQLLHSEFPNVRKLKTQFPVVIYEGKDVPTRIEMRATRPSSWTALSAISSVAKGAVLVSEDWAFYQHKGYDPNQIKEAIHEDLEEGRFARGASTITQQVARNVYLDKDKNLWRKVKELYLATELEAHVGKSKILEVYFNIAEWGEGIFGIGAAARKYFGKTPSQLTAKEGAFLAMLLPSPKRYGASFRDKKLTDYASSTIDDILSKMTQAHYLTDEQRAAEAALPLSFEEGAPSSPEPAPSSEPAPEPAQEDPT